LKVTAALTDILMRAAPSRQKEETNVEGQVDEERDEEAEEEALGRAREVC
jgi:hypothetical protein